MWSIDNRRRGCVNKGRNKQKTQPKPEKEGSPVSMPGFGRLGNRPCE